MQASVGGCAAHTDIAGAPEEPIARAMHNAWMLGVSKGEPVQGAKILARALQRESPASAAELAVPAPPVRTLPIREVVPDLVVECPFPSLAEQVHDLHRRFHSSS